MRLAFKLILALTLAIFVVLGVNAFVRIQREVALFEEDTRKDSRVLGRALAGAVGRIWTTVGEAEALDLVEDADSRDSHVAIRWLWLGNGQAGDFRLSPDALRLLEQGREVAVKAPSPDHAETFLYSYVPVSVPGDRLAAIELRESLAAEQHYVRRTIIQAAVATGTLVLLCGLLAGGLGILFVGRPVRRLVAQARRIGAGDLSPSHTPPRRDEIGDLGREIDAMCERLLEARENLEAETATRLATQEQLRHADRLTTVGKLAAGIAHEVGTPLNVIMGHAQLVKDEYPAGSAAHENVLIIAEQAHRVAAIIRQLLDFARQRTLHKSSQDLDAIARQVVTLLDSLAHKRSITLEFVPAGDPVRVQVDAGQIQQVVTNLVVNGIHAMSKGTLTVGTERKSRPSGRSDAGQSEYACIYVLDRGAGIPEQARGRIFEPFFTTKGIGEGTGLGLSVAYGIVKEHGGWIDVHTEEGKGSRFTVWLPVEDAHE